MKRTLAMVVCVLGVLALASGIAKEQTLDQLKAKAEVAKAEDKAPIYTEIAERNLKLAVDFYNQSNPEAGRTALAEASQFAQQATESATTNRKHLKRTEIHLREMAHRLTDLKRALTIEDQPPVQVAIDRLEQLRTQLLQVMFKKDK